MEAFVSVISLIVFVLTICLFFKVWGACNNVARIRRRYCDSLYVDKGSNALVEFCAIATEDTSTLYKSLSQELVLAIRGAYEQNYGNQDGFEKQKNALIESYAVYFKEIGREVPGKIHRMTIQDCQKLY